MLLTKDHRQSKSLYQSRVYITPCSYVNMHRKSESSWQTFVVHASACSADLQHEPRKTRKIKSNWRGRAEPSFRWELHNMQSRLVSNKGSCSIIIPPRSSSAIEVIVQSWLCWREIDTWPKGEPCTCTYFQGDY